MQVAVHRDSEGREYLERSGTGVIVSIAPVSDFFARVTILCDDRPGASSAIRYQAGALVATNDALYQAVTEHFDDQQPVTWNIAWHRHDWVPAELPITALDLTNDTRATLTELQPVSRNVLPNHVPVDWLEELR